MSVDREAIAAWVAASCAAQGVPVRITDPGVVAKVTVLLRGGLSRGGPRQGAQRGRPPRSEPPGRDDPVGVELAAAGLAGHDRREVEHGGDDRSLPG